MCTQTCPGDSSQFCGGEGQAAESIFYNPAPSVNLGPDGYVGCYADPSDINSGMVGKALFNYADDGMTTEMCLSKCKGTYNWAMTSTARQCYCGNDVQLAGNALSPDSACNVACGGNSQEKCGDLYANSLYSLTGKPLFVLNGGTPPTTSSNSTMPLAASTVQTSPVTTPTAETSSNSTMPLAASTVQTSPVTTPTAETTLPLNSTAQTTPPSNATVDLSSNSSAVILGSQISISVSTAAMMATTTTPTEITATSTLSPSFAASSASAAPSSLSESTYVGCFAPNGTFSHSDFKVTGNLTSSHLVPSDCESMCASKGQSYFALLRGEYCGCLTETDMSFLAAVDSGACAAPCEGDATQMCGGQKALGVYQLNGTIAGGGSLVAVASTGNVTAGAVDPATTNSHCKRRRRRSLRLDAHGRSF